MPKFVVWRWGSSLPSSTEVHTGRIESRSPSPSEACAYPGFVVSPSCRSRLANGTFSEAIFQLPCVGIRLAPQECLVSVRKADGCVAATMAVPAGNDWFEVLYGVAGRSRWKARLVARGRSAEDQF